MRRRGFIQTLGLLAGAAAVPPSMARGLMQLVTAGIVEPSAAYHDWCTTIDCNGHSAAEVHAWVQRQLRSEVKA